MSGDEWRDVRTVAPPVGVGVMACQLFEDGAAVAYGEFLPENPAAFEAGRMKHRHAFISYGPFPDEMPFPDRWCAIPEPPRPAMGRAEQADLFGYDL